MLRPVDEPLRLSEAESVTVGHVSDFYALLYAIDETMPKDSVLCLEGTAIAPDVVAFLEQRPAAAPARIDPNTRWPKPKFFHVSLSGTDLTDLRALADHHAEPEVASHLVVYRAGRVLLWAHDAGSGNVALASSLDEQTIERFREALGDALGPEK
jgi:hypothetical protein